MMGKVVSPHCPSQPALLRAELHTSRLGLSPESRIHTVLYRRTEYCTAPTPTPRLLDSLICSIPAESVGSELKRSATRHGCLSITLTDRPRGNAATPMPSLV